MNCHPRVGIGVVLFQLALGSGQIQIKLDYRFRLFQIRIFRCLSKGCFRMRVGNCRQLALSNSYSHPWPGFLDPQDFQILWKIVEGARSPRSNSSYHKSLEFPLRSLSNRMTIPFGGFKAAIHTQPPPLPNPSTSKSLW